MRSERGKTTLRCAVYTRVSTEHGLEQEFNSLDNQREASEAYIKSQAHEGWRLIRARYDDGGYSGGSMDRPALKRLLDDVRAHRIDVIVVYKVDRLSRSLADFAKLVELFDAHQVSFVSVTQAFNTTTSMGRLTLNVLLSFAQFEREVTGERIRDKIAASKRKGIWMGGVVPLGCRVENRALHVVEEHAAFLRDLFRRYLEIGSVVRLQAILDHGDARLPFRTDGTGKTIGGGLISRGHLYKILSNPIYVGRLTHKGQVHDGLHDPIVDQETWDRVQLLLAEHAQSRAGNCQNSDALLAGKLFDDRGNRMSPSHALGAADDGAIMSLRPSCKVANTRLDPSPGRRRSRSSDRSQKPCARPRPLPIGRVGMGCIIRTRATTARQPILPRCARATTMQPYAPPSSASSCLERRSRSSLPRGWRVTIRIAS
jgi:site-specific DNA recombinase